MKGIPSSAFLGAKPKSQKESGQVTEAPSCCFTSVCTSAFRSVNTTKDGVPPGCVSAEGEDVGVVGGDHG